MWNLLRRVLKDSIRSVTGYRDLGRCRFKEFSMDMSNRERRPNFGEVKSKIRELYFSNKKGPVINGSTTVQVINKWLGIE